MERTGVATRGELGRRRRVAARWALVSAAPAVGLVLAILLFGGAEVAVLAGVVLALLVLPVVRAATIVRRRRGHFQPFQLLLLGAACVVQVIGAAVALAGGSAAGSLLLGLWALATGTAVRLVQRSQLVT